jgi:hypothetical protein
VKRNLDVRRVHEIKTVETRWTGQVAYVGVELCTQNLNRIPCETQSSMEICCGLKMDRVQQWAVMNTVMNRRVP